MIRKTLTILSLIGLLLSVGLWGVSYIGLAISSIQGGGGGAGSDFRHDSHTDFFMVDGEAVYHRSRSMPATSESTTDCRFGLGVRLIYYDYIREGWSWWRPHWSMSPWGRGFRRFTVPLWLPAALFACPCFILLWVPPLVRRKRRQSGLCVGCGYNLRGLTEPRCPECGMPSDSIGEGQRRPLIRRSLIIVVAFVGLLVSVKVYRTSSLTVRSAGTLSFVDLEGGCYAIIDDDETTFYEPQFNRQLGEQAAGLLQEARTSEAVRVSFKGTLALEQESLCLGRLLDVESIHRVPE